jgi:predicted transcriptional regulator
MLCEISYQLNVTILPNPRQPVGRIAVASSLSLRQLARLASEEVNELDLPHGTTYYEDMEVQLTPEEQAQLAQVARRTGRNAEEVAREAIHSFLQYEKTFIEAVEKGLASLDRGEHVSHEEVGKRIEKLFKP